MSAAILIVTLLFAAGEPTKDLVAAAKEAKSKRKQPSTTVLTNADVKNSKGKLIHLPGKVEETPEKKIDQGLSPLEQLDENYRRRLETEEKFSAAGKKVQDLARELEAIEFRYYEENDPDRRDKLIRQQFQETRQQLLEAAAELELVKPESTEPAAGNP